MSLQACMKLSSIILESEWKASRETFSINKLTTRTSGGPAVLHGRVNEPSQVSVDGKGVLVGADKTFQTIVDVPAGGSKNVTIKTTDASGNSTEQVWQLSAQSGLGFASPCEYDADGNMTARYEFQADGTVKVRRYEWDDGARLTAVTVGAETSPKVPTAGAIRTEWTYDVGGRRVREITKTRTATATWTTDRDVRYVWDGTGIIQERDTASNAVLTDYYTAGEVQFSPSTLNSQPSTYYYSRDHLGSVRELVDTTGTVRARYDYDPYGVRTKLSGDLDTEIGYTGHRYHSTSGLHLALYRAYDGELGRWISEDPIGEEDEVNLYGYVGGGPLSAVDPFGLWNLNLFDPKDPVYGGTEKRFTTNGSYSVGAHGNSEAVGDTRGKKVKRLSPDDLAKLIRQQPDYHDGQEVTLVSCWTGYADPGKEPYAKRLARALSNQSGKPTRVWAPDGYVWPKYDPPMVTTARQFTPDKKQFPDPNSVSKFVPFDP